MDAQFANILTHCISPGGVNHTILRAVPAQALFLGMNGADIAKSVVIGALFDLSLMPWISCIC